MTKARVAPVLPVTIPRLEMTAAVLSVRITKYVKLQLNYEEVTEVFWMDSDVVLGYISTTHADVRGKSCCSDSRIHGT